MDTVSVAQNGASFLSDTLNLSYQLLNDILVTINEMKFIPGEESLWNFQMAELTTDISRFVEVTTLGSRIILADNRKLMGAVKDSHIHLLFIMKGMNQAQQKQDRIALEELLKYELKDNLTLWKIDLIPQIKRLLTV